MLPYLSALENALVFKGALQMSMLLFTLREPTVLMVTVIITRTLMSDVNGQWTLYLRIQANVAVCDSVILSVC